MSVTTRRLSTIEAQYRARTRRSAQLYQEACRVIPAGLTHDSRTTLPEPGFERRVDPGEHHLLDLQGTA